MRCDEQETKRSPRRRRFQKRETCGAFTVNACEPSFGKKRTQHHRKRTSPPFFTNKPVALSDSPTALQPHTDWVVSSLLWQRSVILAALPSPTTEWCKPRWRSCGTRFRMSRRSPTFYPALLPYYSAGNSGWYEGVAWDESRYPPLRRHHRHSVVVVHKSITSLSIAPDCRTVKVIIQYTRAYGCFEQSTSTYTFALFPYETNENMCRMEVSVTCCVSVLSRENFQKQLQAELARRRTSRSGATTEKLYKIVQNPIESIILYYFLCQ